MRSNPRSPAVQRFAMLGALGVVFGDIGTSPLYALRTVFERTGVHDNVIVYGSTSMAIWCVILVVSLLYVRTLCRFDNDGEGGLLALLALIRRTNPTKRAVAVASTLAIVGVSMFLADSMITPAISVLSAIEGLTVDFPSLAVWIVPATAVILLLLFLVQRFGTARIAHVFGPIMFAWFIALAASGAWSLAQTPAAALALSPHWIVLLVWQYPWTAFLALGGVVLTVTGAEALFADMGHFGRRPIQRAWFVVAFPALVITYLGQTAAVLRDPSASSNPFYAALPARATLPMVILATIATVIASQAVVSGAFSAVQQAGRLNLLPRLRVVHTSSVVRGQVHLPAVNLMLGCGTILLVFLFHSSASLAAAYGFAVTVTFAMTATLLLVLLVARRRIRSVAGVVGVGMLVVIALIFVANLPKLDHGGILPLGVGACLIVVMWTWQRGFHRLDSSRHARGVSVASVARTIAGISRTPGITVFLTTARNQAPSALMATLAQYGVLSETTLVLTLRTSEAPRDHGVTARTLAPGFIHVTAQYGYLEPPHVIESLSQLDVLQVLGLNLEHLREATYVLSSNTPVLNDVSPLPAWQQRTFMWLDRMTLPPERLFRLPAGHTVVIGRELLL